MASSYFTSGGWSDPGNQSRRRLPGCVAADLSLPLRVDPRSVAVPRLFVGGRPERARFFTLVVHAGDHRDLARETFQLADVLRLQPSQARNLAERFVALGLIEQPVDVLVGPHCTGSSAPIHERSNPTPDKYHPPSNGKRQPASRMSQRYHGAYPGGASTSRRGAARSTARRPTGGGRRRVRPGSSSATESSSRLGRYRDRRTPGRPSCRVTVHAGQPAMWGLPREPRIR